MPQVRRELIPRLVDIHLLTGVAEVGDGTPVEGATLEDIGLSDGSSDVYMRVTDTLTDTVHLRKAIGLIEVSRESDVSIVLITVHAMLIVHAQMVFVERHAPVFRRGLLSVLQIIDALIACMLTGDGSVVTHRQRVFILSLSFLQHINAISL